MIRWVNLGDKTASDTGVLDRKDIAIVYTISHLTKDGGLNPETGSWSLGPKHCLKIEAFTTHGPFSVKYIEGLSYSEAKEYPVKHEKEIMDLIIKMVDASPSVIGKYS